MPDYDPNTMVRLTMAVGQYWSNTQAMMELVNGAGASNGWEGAPIVLYAQVSCELTSPLPYLT